MGRLGWFLAYMHVRKHILFSQNWLGLLGASSIFSKFVHVRAQHFNPNDYSRARGILLASVRGTIRIMCLFLFFGQAVNSKPYDVPRSCSLLGVSTCLSSQSLYPPTPLPPEPLLNKSDELSFWPFTFVSHSTQLAVSGSFCAIFLQTWSHQKDTRKSLLGTWNNTQLRGENVPCFLLKHLQKELEKSLNYLDPPLPYWAQSTNSKRKAPIASRRTHGDVLPTGCLKALLCTRHCARHQKE